MRMVAASKYVQFLEHLATERVLRKHAFDGEFDSTLRVLIEQLLQAGRLEVAKIAGVMVIELVRQLPTGDLHLASVEDDDVIAGVDVRGVSSFVLTAQAGCHFG